MNKMPYSKIECGIRMNKMPSSKIECGIRMNKMPSSKWEGEYINGRDKALPCLYKRNHHLFINCRHFGRATGEKSYIFVTNAIITEAF